MIGSCESGGDRFILCCRIAARAQQQLLPPVPVIGETIILPGQCPLVLLPVESTPWPTPARRSAAMVTAPAVLQLMLETQSPFLWLRHGSALRDLGFSPPSKQAWAEACVRQTGGERLRSPGLVERSPGMHSTILSQVEKVLEILERGELPEGPLNFPTPQSYASVAAYYRDGFDTLSEAAARLRSRAMRILSRRADERETG